MTSEGQLSKKIIHTLRIELSTKVVIKPCRLNCQSAALPAESSSQCQTKKSQLWDRFLIAFKISKFTSTGQIGVDMPAALGTTKIDSCGKQTTYLCNYYFSALIGPFSNKIPYEISRFLGSIKMQAKRMSMVALYDMNVEKRAWQQ